MRVYVTHFGYPRPDDSSVRSWRAIRWLAARHETHLIPIRGPGAAPPPDACGGLTVERPLEVRRERRRWPPWPSREDLEGISRGLLSHARAGDWIWLGWWPVALAVEMVDRLQHRGCAVSWDWDSLSLLHLTAARALRLRDPLRALARLADATWLLWFERFRLAGLDVLSTPSERDRRWLESVTRRPVLCVRNCVEVGDEPDGALPTHPVVAFLGSLGFPPNAEGLEWFLSAVWPGIRRRRPEAEFHVAGRDSLPGGRVPAGPGVRFLGEVADARGFLTGSRVVVVPIRFGSGIPFKALDAAAAARPLVTTPYVRRTLGVTPPSIRIAKSAADFGQEVLDLLDGCEAGALGRGNFRWVKEHYSVEAWSRDMLRLEEAALGVASSRRAGINPRSAGGSPSP